ncbi:hypothetical protein SAMN05216439_1954 [Methanobrevibacter gottschalkii]|uniref:Uncharacterized protein n=1 Tax=Methanobrevibacter gottschalkii TaxID=190974 RepID=A0A1H7MGQ8_9EURY|nr:hypothetical protein [Methanobrevibacter gottschalkii]SEL09797.1 hypothetical protein SAMN05216439_1954 [Methanobrevibacter gottschalkii]
MFKFNKYILFLVVFMVLFLMPLSFAEENSTNLQEISNDDSINKN